MIKAASTVMLFAILATYSASVLRGAESLEIIHLPPPQTSVGLPLMQALSRRMSTKEFADKTISREDLSNLLWAAFGINRPESGKRTAATAVNCQDIQIYVVLRTAAHIYDAQEHCLIPMVNRDVRSLAATQSYAQVAAIQLVYVSDYGKMADSFKDKKPLYAAFHAGAISQNVYLYCASAGLATVVRDSVDRDGLKQALNLNEHQVVVMGQSVGYAAGP
jgi:SagB-type dehydrogenase family enzyme